MTLSTQEKKFDHSSDDRFRDYYAEKSAGAEARAHFERIRDKLLVVLGGQKRSGPLRVLDIGCNAGTQSRVWAEAGHRVTGLDVNGPLLEIARERASKDGLKIQFDLGTATQLPYADGSQDVCLLLELLEHVQDWQSCVNEAVRVLAPGGVLYLSTTNALCPKQQEFFLPMYSWYPGFVKRKCEKMAVTTHPQWVNHARYPAVHWFTWYELKRYLQDRGMRCMDRFDLLALSSDPQKVGLPLKFIQGLPPVRLMAHVMTAGTAVAAVKKA